MDFDNVGNVFCAMRSNLKISLGNPDTEILVFMKKKTGKARGKAVKRSFG